MPPRGCLLPEENDTGRLSRSNRSSLEPRLVLSTETMPLPHEIIRPLSYLQTAETGLTVAIKVKHSLSADEIGEIVRQNRRFCQTGQAFYEIAGGLKGGGRLLHAPRLDKILGYLDGIQGRSFTNLVAREPKGETVVIG